MIYLVQIRSSDKWKDYAQVDVPARTRRASALKIALTEGRYRGAGIFRVLDSMSAEEFRIRDSASYTIEPA